MGAVYEADHVGLDKRVAVKLMLERYGDDRDATERFHREARTARRIGHDNIVDVTDVGDTDDGPALHRDGAARRASTSRRSRSASGADAGASGRSAIVGRSCAASRRRTRTASSTAT